MLLLLVHSFVRLALIAIGGGGEASWKASPFGVQESKRKTEMSEIGKKGIKTVHDYQILFIALT